MGSVAAAARHAAHMPDSMLITMVFLACLAIGSAVAGLLTEPAVATSPNDTPRRVTTHDHDNEPDVAIGTVRTVAGPVTVEVESVSGQRFVGRLRHADDGLSADLRPGVVLLVAFDPAARERLFLADDMLAVRATFDDMLLRKGLVTERHLDLIRHGTRSRGVITAMRSTGEAREDHREVELDLMVRRLGGGQFAARETALIRESALDEVAPGSIVDAYYRRDDESAVAVCVPPN